MDTQQLLEKVRPFKMDLSPPCNKSKRTYHGTMGSSLVFPQKDSNWSIDVAACLADVDALLSNVVMTGQPVSKSLLKRRTIAERVLKKEEVTGAMLKFDADGKEEDFFLLLPDEILMKIFQNLDGKALAMAAQVNRRFAILFPFNEGFAHCLLSRWYEFFSDYSQKLYQPLCVSRSWLEPVQQAAFEPDPTVQSQHSWKLIFASNFVVQQVWLQGKLQEMSSRRSTNRRLFVLMSVDDWGNALDQAMVNA